MITKETIDKIFDAVRIEEVIGDFVSDLKKKGVNYMACCPFHDEKTPSFSVSPSKGIYKCFGCGKGGNAINFVMEHEHFTYPEALKYLAKKYNIEIEEKQMTKKQVDANNEKSSLFLVNEFARDFFIKKKVEIPVKQSTYYSVKNVTNNKEQENLIEEQLGRIANA